MNPKILASLWVATLASALLFGWFVWPSVWRFDMVGQTPVKTNIVSGDTYMWTPNGWVLCAPTPQ